ACAAIAATVWPNPDRQRRGRLPSHGRGGYIPSPLLAELAGLLLQVLDTGTRFVRGIGRRAVLDVIIRRTGRVRWAVCRTARIQPIDVLKIDGATDRVTESGCIGVSDFTHDERNLVVLTVWIVDIAHCSVERRRQRQSVVGWGCPVC